MNSWEEKLFKEFIPSPGQHGLEIGNTGSGKTTLMYWLLYGFLNARTQLPPDLWETLLWFDRGKSSEVLQLSRMAPVRLVASSHGWRKLRPGIRSSFQFLISLRGANYPSSEQPKLYRFNRSLKNSNPARQ
ncbi:hypothetical protein MSHOH_2605 [Methanosarcina horonobensis HB-1 = JCM 15518]|uniref:Uncharacterized protein n=1 Tax=Methanosarcina horonobensis HB-1 = JCM 15518 TaxID=1434110 RepID=A0A0E3SHA6_9EURY|nr:hypothetical protein [Methanosarcina horonobensis]AKB79088.1 hypothetical protein MSHOH_2605 [Methanosarcina horonobensis HB-1 = JCM 15518]